MEKQLNHTEKQKLEKQRAAAAKPADPKAPKEETAEEREIKKQKRHLVTFMPDCYNPIPQGIGSCYIYPEVKKLAADKYKTYAHFDTTQFSSFQNLHNYCTLGVEAIFEALNKAMPARDPDRETFGREGK